METIVCECGSDDMEYLGEGGYKCNVCGQVTLSSTGKMKQYLNQNPDASVEDLVANAGVSEQEAIAYLFPAPKKPKLK